MNDVGKLINIISEAVIGKEEAIEKAIICILAGGHILIEDVPGVGKTTMVNAISKSMNLTFSRIQFAPDLLPSDVTGTSIYNQKNKEFEFKKGPIFNNIVLGDEINRTSPRTQSSLLEAMQERQITVDGTTYELPKPFVVLATQNPIEYEGTFSLPEAQLDRFMMKISMGYPDKISETNILKSYKGSSPLKNINPILCPEDILNMQKEVDNVYVDDSLYEYVVEISRKTREDTNLRLGVSPRGTLALFKASQGRAYINNRNYVIPDDIKKLVLNVFSHRIILKPEAKAQGTTKSELLENILKKIKVPVVE